MRIAITGANGYLASLIQLYNPNIEFIRVTRKQVDLSNPEKVREYFESIDFDMCMHTAANPKTADCENYPELTHKINVESAIEIAKVCQEKKARYIFCSTEQIFNGKNTEGPFKEEEPIETVTNYGKHKQEVEAWISSHNDDYLILRLASMIGLALPTIKPSYTFINAALSAIRYKEPTKFTINEKRGVTYAQRLAGQFGKIIELPTGIYHFSSYNNVNTYEVCKYIAKTFGYDDETINTYILPNPDRYTDRFRDYRLDASKIQSYGIELGTMEEDVQMCLKDFGWIK